MSTFVEVDGYYLGNVAPCDVLSGLDVAVGADHDDHLPGVEADGYDFGRYQKLCSLKKYGVDHQCSGAK